MLPTACLHLWEWEGERVNVLECWDYNAWDCRLHSGVSRHMIGWLVALHGGLAPYMHLAQSCSLGSDLETGLYHPGMTHQIMTRIPWKFPSFTRHATLCDTLTTLSDTFTLVDVQSSHCHHQGLYCCVCAWNGLRVIKQIRIVVSNDLVIETSQAKHIATGLVCILLNDVLPSGEETVN